MVDPKTGHNKYKRKRTHNFFTGFINIFDIFGVFYTRRIMKMRQDGLSIDQNNIRKDFNKAYNAIRNHS